MKFPRDDLVRHTADKFREVKNRPYELLGGARYPHKG